MRWYGAILALCYCSTGFPAWGAGFTPEYIRATIASGVCPSPLARAAEPDLREMCGRSEEEPLLEYNLCLNKWQALNQDVYKYNAIVDECSKGKNSTAGVPRATTTTSEPSTTAGTAKSSTSLALIKKRLTTGICETGMQKLQTVTPESLNCPTVEESSVEAFMCQNKLRETNDMVSRYNDWVQRCNEAMSGSSDDLKKRLYEARVKSYRGRNFETETNNAQQQSLRALKKSEEEVQKVIEARAKATAEAERKAAAAKAARRKANQARQSAQQTYQPPAQTPVGESCRMYSWYVQCLGESPLSYCIDTIHQDRPNCVP